MKSSILHRNSFYLKKPFKTKCPRSDKYTDLIKKYLKYFQNTFKYEKLKIYYKYLIIKILNNIIL